ncbi:MAG: cyclase family protein [Candidatus Brocadia sp. AMX2]|uniref:Cyclase family protein n=1 Tax=Candidatus Brocadia sinica JPN1 TaxID=1197129 RepID=A0ABQ0JUI3_9BACT|nr:MULTISPECIES: cyclase family protein [Brocadia]MBC6933995.1 cyclase family protein [Candidatus Brocadia sp.]MBL1170226.1 cyclase family protein [Candidatus Brocadia sp. AMX1]NOG41735.1 cyclase family protein [Planctomycetota bacterium]GIK14074.1 MAG: cyclase [Candidatus Brocadia sinica]KAA0241841.1 MAG: cyclase family protein [Candidatus Brocadia sp. AMX2]
MNFYDITLTISDTLVTWPADPAVSIRKTSLISQGSSCNLSELTLGSHCGTHIDASYHFEENGIKIDQIPLDYLIENVTVFEIKNKEKIDLGDLKSLKLNDCERVIFKTINSTYWKFSEFKKDFVYITKEAAQYLADNDVKLVGIDYLSVEKFQNKHADTHHVFLKKGIIIIEGLDLSNVKAGDYELIALPLKIKDGDGSPARVILKSIR